MWHFLFLHQSIIVIHVVINKKKLLCLCDNNCQCVRIVFLWTLMLNIPKIYIYIFFTIHGALQKSMEEEKKEHVEKAGDLLKWVSNLSKTLSKEEGEKAEKTDLPKQQVHRCPLNDKIFHKYFFLFSKSPSTFY